MARYLSLHDRLMENTLRDHRGCKLWTGYCQTCEGKQPPLTQGAYGRINLHVPGVGSRKFLVHRVALALSMILEIYPEYNYTKEPWVILALLAAARTLKLDVDHRCRSTLCTEPAHLEWVSQRLNNDRKYIPRAPRKRRPRRTQKPPLSIADRESFHRARDHWAHILRQVQATN